MRGTSSSFEERLRMNKGCVGFIQVGNTSLGNNTKDIRLTTVFRLVD